MGTANDENAAPAVDVEPVDRLHEAEAGDLKEVVERLAGPCVAPREVAREWQETISQFLAGALIARPLPAHEQLCVVAASVRGAFERRLDLVKWRWSH